MQEILYRLVQTRLVSVVIMSTIAKIVVVLSKIGMLIAPIGVTNKTMLGFMRRCYNAKLIPFLHTKKLLIVKTLSSLMSVIPMTKEMMMTNELLLNVFILSSYLIYLASHHIYII